MDCELLKQFYIDEHKTGREISDLTGVSLATIHRELKKNGILTHRKVRGRVGVQHTQETKVKIGNACRGSKHYLWSSVHSYRIDNEGYVVIKDISGKYKREHRLIAENWIGRPLQNNEVVHHVDGCRVNNRIENLMVFVNNIVHLIWHYDPSRVKPSEILFDGRNYDSRSYWK
jgi:hypothetical protein